MGSRNYGKTSEHTRTCTRRVGCYITKRSVAAGRGRYASLGAAEPSYTTVQRRERPRENERVTRYHRPVTHSRTRSFVRHKIHSVFVKTCFWNRNDEVLHVLRRHGARRHSLFRVGRRNRERAQFSSINTFL